MYKQVYDLTTSDLDKFPIWYFPMDDTVENELSVKPLDSNDALYPDYQVIVKTDFIDVNGKHYPGFIYWCVGESVAQWQPTLFVNQKDSLSFWNGILIPSWEKEGKSQQALCDKFPIKFRSQECAGLSAIHGELSGLYFLDSRDEVQYI